MNSNEQHPPRIPDWFPEALRVMRRIDSAVSDLEGALHRASGMEGLDPHMSSHMERTREVVRALDGTLALMDERAGEILARLFGRETADFQWNGDQHQAVSVYSGGR